MVFVKQEILQKEQVNEYKMTKRKIYEKFTNLRKPELNTKNNKNPYARDDIMSTIIKRCREKSRGIRAEHYEKKCKLIKVGVSMFHLELMFISINFYQQQKIDEKGHTHRYLIFEEKNLVVNLLELIQVIQKTVMAQIMRLVTQKHLLMSLKIKK